MDAAQSDGKTEGTRKVDTATSKRMDHHNEDHEHPYPKRDDRRSELHDDQTSNIGVNEVQWLGKTPNILDVDHAIRWQQRQHSSDEDSNSWKPSRQQRDRAPVVASRADRDTDSTRTSGGATVTTGGGEHHNNVIQTTRNNTAYTTLTLGTLIRYIFQWPQMQHHTVQPSGKPNTTDEASGTQTRALVHRSPMPALAAAPATVLTEGVAADLK